MSSRPCKVPGCPAFAMGGAWDVCTVHEFAMTAAQSGCVDWECTTCGENFKAHELVALPDYGKHAAPGRKHAACKRKEKKPTKKQRAKAPKPLFEGLGL